MRHTRTFVLSLFFVSAAFSCAQIASPPGNGEQVGSGGESGDGDGDDSVPGTGGIVHVNPFSGGSNFGGAGPTSGGSPSTGGSGGPTPIASCSDHAECNDQNPCTDDACNSAGQCEFVNNGTCQCTPLTAATACNDDNPCTDDTCVDFQCEYSNNTATCNDDGNACTNDVCSDGACTHPDGQLCTTTTVTLRSVRDGNAGQWVTVHATTSLLLWNVAQSAGSADIFDKVNVSPSSFKLLHVATGNYVTLSAADDFIANATEEDAAVFESPTCGATGFGLNVTTDDDGGTFAAAEPGGEIKARSGGCDAGNANAWERFEIIPTGS